MRNFRALFLALFVGGALFAALPAIADEPSEACGDDPAVVGESSVTVCVSGTGLLDGNLTASDEGDNNGYVVADGDSTNPGCLDGFIGVQVVDGDVQVVAAADGDYEYPADPAGEPDPEGLLEDCSP